MDTLSPIDWAWVAGILEGEASFTFTNGYPRITLGMTDEDIILTIANFFGVNYHKNVDNRKPHYKPIYQLHIIKTDVLIECFLELFPFLGKRRRAKINEFREYWLGKGLNVPKPHELS